MSVTEFFPYLLGWDTTQELVLQLAEVYSVRTRVHDEERVLAHA